MYIYVYMQFIYIENNSNINKHFVALNKSYLYCVLHIKFCIFVLIFYILFIDKIKKLSYYFVLKNLLKLSIRMRQHCIFSLEHWHL